MKKQENLFLLLGLLLYKHASKIVLLKLIRTIARIYNATDKNIQDWVVLTGDRDRVRVIIIIIIIIIIINVNVKIP